MEWQDVFWGDVAGKSALSKPPCLWGATPASLTPLSAPVALTTSPSSISAPSWVPPPAVPAHSLLSGQAPGASRQWLHGPQIWVHECPLAPAFSRKSQETGSSPNDQNTEFKNSPSAVPDFYKGNSTGSRHVFTFWKH